MTGRQRIRMMPVVFTLLFSVPAASGLIFFLAFPAVVAAAPASPLMLANVYHQDISLDVEVQT